MAEITDYAWSKDEAAILKAVFNGGGDAAMQRRALVHIVEMLCSVNQTGFDPENMHLTAFHAGRKWVARQIQNAITIPIEQLVKETVNEPRSNGVITATQRATKQHTGGTRRAGRNVTPA